LAPAWLPIIAGSLLTGGGLTAASLLAGAQTTGAQFPSTFSALKEQGKSDEEALRAATGSSLLAGAVTTALTAVGGATGVEALVRRGGKEFAKREIVKRIAVGSLKEVPEEVLDEAASQIIEAQTVTPDKPVTQVVDEFMATVPDLALQVALLGGAGETLQAARGRGEAPQEAGRPQPVTPAPDTDFARRAAMEGATEFRDTTAGVPVVVEGITIATIPPGSDLSPDDVAAFVGMPDGPAVLKRYADQGRIVLPEIVKPVEGVDETLTDEMNQNVAAGAANAPATVEALEEAQALYEAQTLARERQAAEETLRQQEAERAAAEERGNLEEIASVNEAELAEAKAVLSPLVPGLEVVMGDDFGIAPINVSYDGTQLRVAPGFLRKLKKRFPDSWKEVLDLIVDEELSHKRDIDSRGGESRAQTQWAAEWQSAPSVLKRLVAAAYRKFNSLTDSEKGAELVRMRDQVSRLGRITESASSEPDRRSAAEHIARLLSSTQEQASPVTAETSTEPGEFAEKRPSPGEEKPVISDPQSVGTADDKPTQTASGKKVGDKIESGEDLSVAAEDDQSTPGMPGELTVLEVEGILDAKKNKVFARRRDMTPDEISLAQEKIRKRNAVAAEMGLPQEKIPQPAEETLRQQTPAPTITDEQRENINRLRRKIINEALGGQPPSAQTPAPTEQSVKLELTPDESGATGAGMKEEIQQTPEKDYATGDPSTPFYFEDDSWKIDKARLPKGSEVIETSDGPAVYSRLPDGSVEAYGVDANGRHVYVGKSNNSFLPSEYANVPLSEVFSALKGSRTYESDRLGDMFPVLDQDTAEKLVRENPPTAEGSAKPAPQPITPTGEPQSIPLDQLTVIPEDMARAEASRDSNDERWQRASQSKEPIRAIRRPDGTLRIMDGHHRYLAARDRGDASIPVTIEPPFTPAQGKPTDSLPADQPTSGDVGAGAAVQRDPSKPEQMTPEERFNRSPAGVVKPKSLPLGTSKKSTRSRLLAQFDRGAAWADKNDSEKAELSSFQKRNDLFKTRQRNGHFGTDKAAEDYAFWRGAAAFFEAKQANSERRAERSLSGTQKVAQHSDDILIALDSNDPVSAEAVDTYGIKLPEGYVRQGELYVFQPTVTTPTETPAAPRSPAENLVSFTAANGQKLVGEVQSVTGNKATVAYSWNGKMKTQVVPVSQLGSPVASVATPPKYQYNQEQNTRKLGKHFPTALGVHANHDFRKSFASMAKDTSLGQTYRMIARMLSKMPEFKNMDLHLVADENIDYAGEYSWNKGKPSIAINLRLIARGQVDALGSILHEALHHVTLAKVRNPQGAFENEVVSKLDLIRESVREYAESKGLGRAAGLRTRLHRGVHHRPVHPSRLPGVHRVDP
jgi:hypothetical protein